MEQKKLHGKDNTKKSLLNVYAKQRNSLDGRLNLHMEQVYTVSGYQMRIPREIPETLTNSDRVSSCFPG